MAQEIWPSANDVTPSAGNGNKLLEQQLAAWIKVLAGQNFVVGGLTLPATDPDLTIDVAGGTAWIDGHTVIVGTPLSVALTANNTNHIFLKMIKDGGGNANEAELEANITGTPPADSVKIGTAVAGPSTVTSTTDERILTAATTHNHTTPQSGDTLGANVVGTTQIKKTATSFTTASFNALIGTTQTFLVTGQRIGDFTIIHNDATMGRATLTQIQLEDSETENTTWELVIAANASSGTSGKTTSVKWFVTSDP